MPRCCYLRMLAICHAMLCYAVTSHTTLTIRCPSTLCCCGGGGEERHACIALRCPHHHRCQRRRQRQPTPFVRCRLHLQVSISVYSTPPTRVLRMKVAMHVAFSPRPSRANIPLVVCMCVICMHACTLRGDACWVSPTKRARHGGTFTERRSSSSSPPLWVIDMR